MPSVVNNQPNNYWGGANSAVTYRPYNPFAKSTYVPPKKTLPAPPPAVQPPAVQPPAAAPTQPRQGIGAWFSDVYGDIKNWFNRSINSAPNNAYIRWTYGNNPPINNQPSVKAPPSNQAGGYWRGTNANYSVAPTYNTLYNPRVSAGVPQNTFQINRTYWSTGNQSHDPSFYRTAGEELVAGWKAAGGVNIPVTDWFDPYDPAGSPYMQSQYVPVAESAGGSGGWGGWGGYGGYGGYGGNSYTPEDSAAFYSGNYTQRRNRWSETLLTWGLRQQ